MTHADFKKEPVIIGGCGRSGTTLLLSILSAHPNLFAIPQETKIFCPGAYDFADPPPDEPRAAPGTLSRDLLFDLQMRSLDLSLPIELGRIEDYLAGATSFHSRWVEKTPKNVLFFGPILDLFHAQVKLIHLVRDGRDVVTSVHPGRSGYHIPIRRWVTEVRAGLRFREHPAVFLLKYEDLVLDFVRTIGKLCDFLGERVHPDLLDWYAHTRIRTHDSFENETVEPLHLKAIERRRTGGHEARVEAFMCDQDARTCLGELGYV